MVQGKLPPSPGKHKWWEKWVVDRKELGESMRKRSAVVVTTKAARNKKRKTPTPTPRQGLWSSSNSSVSTTLPANSVTPTSSSNSYSPKDQNYWNLGLATNTFGLVEPPQEDDEDDLLEIVTNCIRRLKEAYQTSNGWRLVINNLDAKGLYSEHDQHNFR
jgi:hypothetical protein